MRPLSPAPPPLKRTRPSYTEDIQSSPVPVLSAFSTTTSASPVTLAWKSPEIESPFSKVRLEPLSAHYSIVFYLMQ